MAGSTVPIYYVSSDHENRHPDNNNNKIEACQYVVRFGSPRSLSLSLSLSLFLSIQGTVLKSLYLNFSNIHVRFRYPHKHVAAGTVPAENKRTELKWYPTDSSNCSMQTIIWFSLPTKFAIYLFYNANSNSTHISTFPTASIDDGAWVPYCRLSCTTQIIKSNHVKMTFQTNWKK